MSALPWLVEGAVKASCIILIALGAVAMLGRRSAALRHIILSSALACAALSPLFTLVLPAWNAPLVASAPHGSLPWARAAAAPPNRAAAAAPDEAAADPRVSTGVQRWIAIGWIAGAAVALLTLLVGLSRLAWIAAHARPLTVGPWAEASNDIAREYGLDRPVRVLHSDHPTLLVTWGWARPRVVLPRQAGDWSGERIRIVLAHELAHIKRLDWAAQMLAEVVRVVYWFNPLIWLACRRLRHESEQATDDAVLNRGLAGAEYASHLVAVARELASSRRSFLPATPIVRPSSLERRIRAMLNDQINRAPATRSARLAAIAGCVAMAVAVTSAQAAFSTFSGSLFDQRNGLLPGATITLTNQQTQAKHEVRTNGAGRFEFVGLPPGSYTFDATLPGFMTLHGTLEVAGRNVQQDMVMTLGTLQETITLKSGPSVNVSPSMPRPRPAKPESRGCEGGGVPTVGAIGGNIRQPMKLVDVKPKYPAQLAATQTGGLVVFDARIGLDGTIADIRTVSATHPDFEAAAREAVRQWEFSETLLNCAPMEVSMKVIVNFVVE